MPNLRCLRMETSPREFHPQLLKFELKNLTSLELPHDEHTIPVLNMVGAQLKELCITQGTNEANVLQKVFELCTSLECFSFKFRGHTVEPPLPEDVENSKLKKLIWEFSLLPIVMLKAPLLEEVALTNTCFEIDDIGVLNNWLLTETVLQNLTKLVCLADELNGTPETKQEMLLALHKLAKHIICFCPKLENVHFDLMEFYTPMTYNTETNSSVTRFWNLVKEM